MKRNYIHGVIIAIVMLVLSGCGNDTKENPAAAEPSGPYSFFNATTKVTITKTGTCDSGTCLQNSGTCSTGTCTSETYDENSTSTNISVQLLKYGLAEPGQTIQMLPFDSRYGTLLNTVVDTDGNGFAIFEYKPPEGSNYDALRGQDITITAIFEEPIEENANVYVDPNAPPVIILTQDFVLQFR
jgi:hypothetical protein